MHVYIPIALDLTAPTSLGVPLGVLLLFILLLNAINQNTKASKTFSSTSTSGGSYTSPNTMDIKMSGEVSDSELEFMFSEAVFESSQCRINFTVQFQQTGFFVVVGGQVKNQKVNRRFYGAQQISGKLGDVVSGTVTCRGFNEGTWGIGAYKAHSDIHFY